MNLDESLLAEIVEEFTDRCQRGEQPRVENYLEKYPHLADALADILPAIDALQASPRPNQEPSPSGHLDPDQTHALGLPRDDRKSNKSTLRLSQHGFEIQAEIARGGMGVVSRIWDRDFERSLALKVLLPKALRDPHALERFHREAQITGQLQHPGIPPVHQKGHLDDGSPYFTMKLIEGETLATLLRQRPNPQSNLSKFLSIFGQICQTVGYAHSQHTIHRDLKPANVMVGAFGEVQVMDWGLAKILEASHEDAAANTLSDNPPPTMEDLDEQNTVDSKQEQQKDTSEGVGSNTRAGSIMGTLAYMAPEQARGDVERVDSRSDVFGLGAILCEILTGSPPHVGQDTGGLLAQASGGDMKEAFGRLDQSKASPELIKIAKTCLAADEQDRYANAGELADVLEKYQAEVQERLRQAELEKAAAQAKSEEEGRRLRAERARRRTTVALAFVGLLLASVLIGGLAWYRITRIQALAEAKGIGRTAKESVRKVEQSQAELQKTLQEPGGTGWMYTRSTAWESRLEQDRATLTNVGVLLEKAGREVEFLFPNLRSQVTAAKNQLEDNRKDFDVVTKLNRARESSLLIVGGKTNRASVLNDYPSIFREIGLRIFQDDANELTARIRVSPIREQFVAALDDWSVVLWSQKKHGQQHRRLLEIAIGADSDPTRNQIRRLALGGKAQAIAKLAKAYLQDPQKIRQSSPQTLHLCHALLHDPELKTRWLRNAQMYHSEDLELTLRLAIDLQNKHCYEESEGYCRGARGLHRDNPAAWLALGTALSGQDKWEEAVVVCQDVIQMDPNYAPAWTNLGVALINQKKVREGLLALQTATRRDPSSASAWFNLGVALKEQQKEREAKVAYRKAIDLDADYPQAWAAIGAMLLSQKKVDAAIDAFQKAAKKAVNLDPDEHAKIWTNLGTAWESKREFPKSESAYRKAIKLDSNNAGAWAGLGNTLYYQQKIQDAAAAYKKALRVEGSPKVMAVAWSGVGNTLASQGKLNEATVAFRKATRANPKYHQGWNNLGLALRIQKRPKEAIQAYRRAIGLKKRYPKAHFGLGLALIETGQIAKAAVSFGKVKKFVPANHSLHRAADNELRKCQQLLRARHNAQ